MVTTQIWKAKIDYLHFLSGPRGMKQLTPELAKAQANDMAAAAANGGNTNMMGAIMPGGKFTLEY